MGIYFRQTLTVRGPREAFADFVAACFETDEKSRIVGLHFERIAPPPEILPATTSIGRLGNDLDVGVEALTGAPRPTDMPERIRPSVLGTPAARKLRLKTHQALLRWLEKHRPEALAAGRAAIEAHAATGSWSRDEWIVDNWGDVGVCIMDFEVESHGDDRVVVRFWNKGPPANLIVKTMGQRFPAFDFRLAALDDGDEPFVATVRSGEYTEAYVEATDAFITEVDGEPRQKSGYYETPSVIRPKPMTKPLFWLAQRKLSKVLKDYPVYRPIFTGLPSALSREEAQANFEHFLATRHDRLAQLRTFLLSFGVDLQPTKAGLRKLDRWISRYGGLLPVDETGASFETHQPEWCGARSGLNVMFDLATFLGEAVIARYHGFYWDLYLDVDSGLRNDNTSYQMPVVRGPNVDALWRVWPHDRVADVCDGLMARSFMRKRAMGRHQGLNRLASHLVNDLAHWTASPADCVPKTVQDR